MLRQQKVLKYALHKPSGQARVTVDGERIYLGAFNSPASLQRYREIVTRWRDRQKERAVPDISIGALALLYCILRIAARQGSTASGCQGRITPSAVIAPRFRRACEKATVPFWFPNQLRHTAGTALRAKSDLETARTVLGHRSASTTEIYANVLYLPAAYDPVPCVQRTGNGGLFAIYLPTAGGVA